MIGREKRVLLRHYLEQGMNKAAIARDPGISRRTVYTGLAPASLDRETGRRGCHFRRRFHLTTGRFPRQVHLRVR